MLVRMFATLAPSNCSTARLISTLLACGAPWKTIVLPSSRMIDVFSVTSGRRMMSVIFMTVLVKLQMSECRFQIPSPMPICNLQSAMSLDQCLLQLLERRAGRDDVVGVHDVARGHAAAR